MSRSFIILFTALFALSACETTTSGGGNNANIYRIKTGQTAKIQFRMLDSVNALRVASGAGAVELDALLNAAAATHSRDMSAQNRPWHFGSDGSSPLDRIVRVGYTGLMLGENISETYESELETLSAWMSQDNTRSVILDKRALNLGFAWFQEPNGKIWWTMILGG